MSTETVIQAKDIVIGKELPCSVYTADKTLLLAAGHMVNERVGAALLRNGVWARFDAASDEAEVPVSTDDCPLRAFHYAYSRSAGNSRIGFCMSHDERSESYTSWVIGMHEQRGLILSAPVDRENSPVRIADGQTWVFRAFHGIAAFRFSGVIRRIVREPVPYFHVQLPPAIHMRRVRERPRAQVCMPTTLQLTRDCVQGYIEGLIVDLSSSGLRLAVKRAEHLAPHHNVRLRFSVPLLDKLYDIQAAAEVKTVYGVSDPRHPDIQLYGLSLQPESQFDQLVLHGYVQERLVDELDTIWRVLAGTGNAPTLQDSTAV